MRYFIWTSRLVVAVLFIAIVLGPGQALAQVDEAEAVVALIKGGNCYRFRTRNGHVTELSYLNHFGCGRAPLIQKSTVKSKIKNPIQHLVHLTALSLEGSHFVNGAFLKDLSRLKSLHQLDLTYTEYIDDKALVHLKPFVKLESLSVTSGRFTGAGLIHLKDMSRLYHLRVGGRLFGNDGLKALGELRNLTTVDLWGSAISNEGLLHLSKLPKLKYLTIQSSNITSEGIAHLIAVNLEHLHISGCHKIDNAVFQHLTRMKNLRRLHISGILSREGVLRLKRKLHSATIFHGQRKTE